MADVRRLCEVGFATVAAKELAKQIEDAGGGGTVSSDNVTVAAITATNFTFAGGTLTQFCQAIADAIPAGA
ncbi:MAG: hypothetical protein NBV76_05285 [Candidatus Ochrobactrum gambitense]|nr:MAG: hypothetical protein NBV76_05285 [Candidatus Ochrobactrum gambitense]WEK17215.1 MAG: hypothetical protein P0Y54_05675 [Candidatus Ochrobactrum gambitense]